MSLNHPPQKSRIPVARSFLKSSQSSPCHYSNPLVPLATRVIENTFFPPSLQLNLRNIQHDFFFNCCKDNTSPENLFHVFKIISLHLYTGWKGKKILGGVSYPMYLGQFSINSHLNNYINSQAPLKDQDKIYCTSKTPLSSLSSGCTNTVFSKAGCHNTTC